MTHRERVTEVEVAVEDQGILRESELRNEHPHSSAALPEAVIRERR